MKLRAKFTVQSKTQRNSGLGNTPTHDIEMAPVTLGSDEDSAFFEATPSGSIQLGVVSQAAADALELGKTYYVDFSEALSITPGTNAGQ